MNAHLWSCPAWSQSGATCIIHTASPAHGLEDPALYWKVNVDGTKAVISAAQANGVKKLVYTSSAGVVFNGQDLIDVDERLPFPEKAMDAYNESKARAEEMVLAANGEDGLLTVALRPAGIFGSVWDIIDTFHRKITRYQVLICVFSLSHSPGDRQVMAGLSQVYERNQTHFQVGDNTNLFDWTYVGNVAHAHVLAADKLGEELPTDADVEKHKLEIAHSALPPITATIEKHRVPTSEARPLGPYVEPPPDHEKLLERWNDPDFVASAERPVRRSRFDQFSETALSDPDNSLSLSVAGQAFFITNGEPVYFWDFPRTVWTKLDELTSSQRQKKSRIVLPKGIGLLLASGAEWWGWLVGKEPAFTRFRVTFSCASRWYNIEKARRLLGYEPQVGMEDGINRMVEVRLVFPSDGHLAHAEMEITVVSGSTTQGVTLFAVHMGRSHTICTYALIP